jgi:hypothetical protein
MSVQVQVVDERVTTCATASDDCEIFAEEMHRLYLLAFLLTADKDKAEQCFIGELGECVEQIGVFMERARSLARRAIIKHAIRMMRPVPEEGVNGSFTSARWPATWGRSNPFAVIVSLCAFDRFVFVMSVLEGQSVEDCQSLLGCSRQEVVIARELALSLLAATGHGYEPSREGLCTWRALLS